MFALIASGHVELAEVFVLLAAIFAGIAAVVAAFRGDVIAALLPAAVCFIALYHFVL